jgi:hypothetical protein
MKRSVNMWACQGKGSLYITLGSRTYIYGLILFHDSTILKKNLEIFLELE